MNSFNSHPDDIDEKRVQICPECEGRGEVGGIGIGIDGVYETFSCTACNGKGTVDKIKVCDHISIDGTYCMLEGTDYIYCNSECSLYEKRVIPDIKKEICRGVAQYRDKDVHKQTEDLRKAVEDYDILLKKYEAEKAFVNDLFGQAYECGDSRSMQLLQCIIDNWEERSEL